MVLYLEEILNASFFTLEISLLGTEGGTPGHSRRRNGGCAGALPPRAPDLLGVVAGDCSLLPRGRDHRSRRGPDDTGLEEDVADGGRRRGWGVGGRRHLCLRVRDLPHGLVQGYASQYLDDLGRLRLLLLLLMLVDTALIGRRRRRGGGGRSSSSATLFLLLGRGSGRRRFGIIF